jgi:hypothetical protein
MHSLKGFHPEASNLASMCQTWVKMVNRAVGRQRSISLIFESNVGAYLNGDSFKGRLLTFLKNTRLG